MNTSDYSEQLAHLEYFDESIMPLLNALGDVKPNPVQWVTLGMLGRLSYASKGIHTLLPHYSKDISFNYPIGILLRPILLDALTALRLYARLKELLRQKADDSVVNSSISELGMQILSDGLDIFIRDARLFKDNGFISESERIDVIHALTDEWPDFFVHSKTKNEEPVLKHNESLGAKKHFTSLVQDKDLHTISEQLYINYIWFSKYDHFGMLYFSALKRTRPEHDAFVIGSIDLFIHHFANLCDMLQRVSPENNTIHEGYIKAMNYLHVKLARK